MRSYLGGGVGPPITLLPQHIITLFWPLNSHNFIGYLYSTHFIFCCVHLSLYHTCISMFVRSFRDSLYVLTAKLDKWNTLFPK